jgi:hypothetical protein
MIYIGYKIVFFYYFNNSNITCIEYDIDKEDDIHNNTIFEILKRYTDGRRDQKVMEQTHPSHDQLRRMMAEKVQSYSILKHIISKL